MLHRVVTDGASTVLDYGRGRRSVPVHLFRAVVLRDRHCRYPGYDRKPSWCEAHHVVPWAEGGETRLGSLVLLCVRHHQLLHRRGWQLKLLPDATVEVTGPDGLVRTSRPPPVHRC